MPDSTTEIKGPLAEGFAGHGSHKPGYVCIECDRIGTDAYLAGAAAERAAIRAAFKQGVDAYPNHEARWAQFFLNQVLDARQP